MKKNISSFVYKHYIFYNTKNLILRILGLFLISCSAIFYVEIGSPYGFDSVNFFFRNCIFIYNSNHCFCIININFILCAI